MAISKEDIINAISEMKTMDVLDLVKEMEKHFGISASAPVANVIAKGEDSEDEVKVEEQSQFNVTLKSFGAQKIAVIKELRVILSIGLKEAKEKVDSAPSIIKEGIDKDAALEIKKKIEDVGGEVVIE